MSRWHFSGARHLVRQLPIRLGIPAGRLCGACAVPRRSLVGDPLDLPGGIGGAEHEDRARLIEILNSYSRQALNEKDRLRIGFGALKNGAAFEAITSALGEVLMHNAAPVRVAS